VLNDGLAIPIGINMITGSRALHPEISLNLMPYIDQYQSMFSANDNSDKYIYIIPGFGCRYMKNASKFFYRAALCPSVELDPPSSDFWNMDVRFLIIVNAGIGLRF
jgi:hypothetical protein